MKLGAVSKRLKLGLEENKIAKEVNISLDDVRFYTKICQEAEANRLNHGNY